MTKIIRVNLSDRQVNYEEVPSEYRMLGGRSLTGTIVFREVPPDCDPFGEEAKLVFAPGLLGGVSASSVHRLSVGGKSPLTGGIKESNSGGNVALKIARLGIKAVIIEGSTAGELLALKIDARGARLIPAGEAAGLEATPTADWIKAGHGGKVAFSLVGPAGEKGLLASAIVNSDLDGMAARFSARGGLAAVMGRKGLKAIIIDDQGSGAVQPARKEVFRAAVKEYTRSLRETPQTRDIYSKYGTNAMVDITNELGGMPTRNFSEGRFEAAGQINGTALRNLILERGGAPSHACVPGCIIKSSNIFPGRNGAFSLRSYEYETVVLCGSNCGLGDLDDIAELNVMINEHGLDSIEIGGCIGLAMDAGLVAFGDAEGAKDLVREIRNDTVLGRVLGNGADITGRVLGVKRIPTVKGQMMPGYEPRTVKGHGVTFATSPMGADHTAGMTIREGLDPKGGEGQVEASRRMQKMAVLYDSLGFCLFVHMAVKEKLEIVRDMVNALLDESLSVEDLLEMSAETLKREVSFNRQAGLGVSSDRLPDFCYREKLPPVGTTFTLAKQDLEKITDW